MNELINEAAEYEVIRTFLPKQINGLTWKEAFRQ